MAHDRRRSWPRLAIAVPIVMGAVGAGVDVPRIDASVAIRNDRATIRLVQDGWDRIPRALPASTMAVGGATGGPAGFVVVGSVHGPNRAPTGAIWTSGDGTTFSRVPSEGLPEDARFVTGAVFWRGRYWAVAHASDHGSVWTSRDARTWAVEDVLGGAALALEKADGLGLLGIAWTGIALSSDGTTWTPTNLTGVVLGVARLGGRVFAVTDRSPSASDRRAVVWSTSDGSAWLPLADLGPLRLGDTVGFASWRAALWATTFPGDGARRSQVWRSTDGEQWEPVVTDQRADSTFDRLTPLGRHLVATGWDDRFTPGAWVTRDGRRWVAADLPRPRFGRLTVTATRGSTLLALCSAENTDIYRFTAP
jgi:hypothetical protein